MTDVATQMDALRIAVGETDALAAVTAESYDREDWSGVDLLHVERLASLLGLIEKSAAAALTAFHRLSVAVVNEQPAPVGQRWDDGTASGE